MGKILQRNKTKVSLAVNAIATAIMLSPVANASGGGDGAAKMKSLIKEILPYLSIIGIPIALMGGFKLIMAFRNDQGDAVPAAAKDLAIGILITLFSVIGGAILNQL